METMKEIKNVDIKHEEESVTVQETELQEQLDDAEELKLKKELLKSNEARLNGGFCPIMRRDLLAVDQELRIVKRAKRLKELEKNYDAPVMVQFRYQENEEYRSLLREMKQEVIDKIVEDVERLEEQKKKLPKDIDELRVRIKELEAKIKKPEAKSDDDSKDDPDAQE